MSEESQYDEGQNAGQDEYTEGEITNRDARGQIMRPAMARFAAYLENRASIEAPLVAEELSADQMERILSAQTEDELDEAMKMLGLIGLRNFHDGDEFQINSWHVAFGANEDFKNRFGVFAVIQCQDLDNGAEFSVDTGVERVIGFLRMCETFGRFALPVRVVKQRTQRGNDMITLLPARNRTVVEKVTE